MINELQGAMKFQQEFKDILENSGELEDIVEGQEETSGRARLSWSGIWGSLFRKSIEISNDLEEDFPEGWFNKEIHNKVEEEPQELAAGELRLHLAEMRRMRGLRASVARRSSRLTERQQHCPSRWART